jgi:F-box and leucine-rich repeat protein GRR1
MVMEVVCRRLTDMSVIELAGLKGLRRLSVMRVQKLTDNGVYFIGEHCPLLERFQVSYCEGISLEAVHFVLKKARQLQYLGVSGVGSFKRKGVERFCDFEGEKREYSGGQVELLRKFLDKEERRKRESERLNIRFVERSDDGEELY